MKIAHSPSLELPEGKEKFQDPILLTLAEKFEPKKVTPYFFEFLPEAYEAADAIVMKRDEILDLLILDIEKIEARLERGEDPGERELLTRCQAHIEAEQPLCDMTLSEDEEPMVRALGFVSYKPVLVIDEATPDVTELCQRVLDKADCMFFYTVGKPEVHAWFVKKGVDAVTCAGKIHSDLARGFVKAEITSYDDMMASHNLQDARSKGLTELVDREYVIPGQTIIDIRFNV